MRLRNQRSVNGTTFVENNIATKDIALRFVQF